MKHTTRQILLSRRLKTVIVVLLGIIGFTLAPTIAAEPYPTLAFSTYLGGTGPENGQDIAVDAQGYIYIVGNTHSANFPTVNAYQDTLAGFSDVYVMKLNPAGTEIVYSTYLGGSDYDLPYSLAIDSDGSVYVTGRTNSPNFPTVNAIQSTYGGMGDAFVAKLSPDGSNLLYSTYLGGSGSDAGLGISVNAAKHAQIVGATGSANLATPNAYQESMNGTNDILVASLSASGSTLDYLTYLGGSNTEIATAVIAASDGNTYFTGWTDSPDFPLMNPLQPNYAQPGCTTLNTRDCDDGFVARFNSSGTLTYATYLGGNGIDQIHDIALDNNGNIYVAGETMSTNFPTANAYQATRQGNASAFVTKFNAAGSSLIYSTYLGGTNGASAAIGIAVNAQGSAAVTGYTDAIDFPTFKPIQAARGGPYAATDVFITLFKPDGAVLEFSTYLGGSADEYTEFNPRVTFNQSDNSLYVVGMTYSIDFPVLNALQADPGGTTTPFPIHLNQDAFVVKIELVTQPPIPTPTAIPTISPSDASAERNYFTTHTPTLTWKPVTWAIKYQIEVSQSEAFDLPNDFEGEAAASADSITIPYLEDGFYYWRIQTQKPDGSWTAWKVMDSFTVFVDEE